jgi:hypothetical protein
MLIAAARLRRCVIEGTDGTVGTVKDLLFDSGVWTVRYLDVDTGRWLPGRRIVLSPLVIDAADYAATKLATSLSREQVEKSPPLESDLPVSRQKEIDLAQYYAWGMYWSALETQPEPARGDPDLRSTRGVSGYHVRALDGRIGHVADFLVDDAVWQIRYLVVDTGNWLAGRQVLIPPGWAESVEWESQTVAVDVAKESVEKSPDYDPDAPVNRRYEEVFYDYYGRPKYWTGTGHTV